MSYLKKNQAHGSLSPERDDKGKFTGGMCVMRKRGAQISDGNKNNAKWRKRLSWQARYIAKNRSRNGTQSPFKQGL